MPRSRSCARSSRDSRRRTRNSRSPSPWAKTLMKSKHAWGHACVNIFEQGSSQHHLNVYAERGEAEMRKGGSVQISRNRPADLKSRDLKGHSDPFHIVFRF